MGNTNERRSSDESLRHSKDRCEDEGMADKGKVVPGVGPEFTKADRDPPSNSLTSIDQGRPRLRA